MKIQGVIRTINLWGDSLTQGAGGTSISLQMSWQLPDRLINNYGVGGQTSPQIAGRCGGDPIYITMTGNVFNGVSAVAITSINIQFLSTASDTTTRISSGWINKVRCIVRCDGTTDAYTITPVVASTVSIPAGSMFIPDSIINSTGEINIFWLGRNDSPRTTLPDRVQRCVNILQDASNRYMVIGVLPALDEISGTSAYNNIIATNTILKNTNKEYYIESTPPTTEEMSYIGYTPNSQDITDIGNGVFPTGMHSDNIHLNTFGYAIFNLRLLRRLKYFGW